MTLKPFKISVFLLLITSSLLAQKVEKKFNEKFYTNKDVEIDINASNAEIEVTTWNKNEVAVEATIEIEGIDKKEAEKYLKRWNFEALGNKSTVKIKANSNSFHSIGNDNIFFYNSSGNTNFPKGTVYNLSNNKDHNLFVLPEIELEDFNIDIDDAMKGLENIEFDFDKYSKDGDTYFFQWKDGVNNVTIKSKKEWEKFKKTKEYKKFKKQQEKRKKTLKKRSKALKKKRLEKREALAKARKELRKINRVEVKKALELARKQLKNTQLSYSYITNSKGNDLMINGKKVKIVKKIKVKVPKNATFNLNTRHCKVKLPKTKVNGKVSYGNFKADALNGGKLNISFSPVKINSLNTSTLFLNNVTDAKIASVTNTVVNSKSSDITIVDVYKNVKLVHKFGDLKIDKIHPDYGQFKMFLSSANASVNLSGINQQFNFEIKENPSLYSIRKPITVTLKEMGSKNINGTFLIESKNKKIYIEGKYSQLAITE
ncbi:hypothetical protein [uncultured Tenacibaculum sp.]|uniref:hypothetical protein n=1 Tax=uncultured Tenacibaculum sp. TaxID=174713 RepID=UPI00260206CF|nr:hypothetical protein [uncultured Tenacibaculum sp.]